MDDDEPEYIMTFNYADILGIIFILTDKIQTVEEQLKANIIPDEYMQSQKNFKNCAQVILTKIKTEQPEIFSEVDRQIAIQSAVEKD